MAPSVVGTIAARARTGASTSVTMRGTRACASSAPSTAAATATTTAPPPLLTQPPESTAHATAAISAAQMTPPVSGHGATTRSDRRAGTSCMRAGPVSRPQTRDGRR